MHTFGVWAGWFGFGRDEFCDVVLGSGVTQDGFVGWRVEVLGWGGHAGAWGVRFRGWMGFWGLECTHLGFGRSGFGFGRDEFCDVVLGSGVTQDGFVGWQVEVLGLGGCVGAWGVEFRGWMGFWGLGRTNLGVGRAGFGIWVAVNGLGYKRHDTGRNDTGRHQVARNNNKRHDTGRNDTERQQTARHEKTLHGAARHDKRHGKNC